MRNICGTEYFRSYIDIDAKKEKLFAQGYQASWGFSLKEHKLKLEDIMANKDLAKNLMLPEVEIF